MISNEWISVTDIVYDLSMHIQYDSKKWFILSRSDIMNYKIKLNKSNDLSAYF